MRNRETPFRVGVACLALFTIVAAEICAQTSQTFQRSSIEDFLSRAKITKKGAGAVLYR